MILTKYLWTGQHNLKRNFMFFLLVVLSVVNQRVIAQGWEHSFGEGSTEDVCRYAAPTADGGFVFCGSQGFIDGSRGILLVRTDSDGKEIWKNLVDSTLTKDGNAVIISQDQHIIVSGFTDNLELYLAQYNMAGDLEWSKTIMAENTWATQAFDLLETPDHGFLLVGSAYTPANKNECYILKTDSEGNQIWDLLIPGSPEDDNLFHITPTLDGHYMAAGEMGLWDTQEGFLVKFDLSGQLLWTKNYAGKRLINSVLPLQDGGYAATGFASIDTLHALILRTDADGNELWFKTYDAYTVSRKLFERPDGGFYITGTFFPEAEWNNVLTSLDAAGNVIWRKEIGRLSARESMFNSFRLANGNYIYVGESRSNTVSNVAHYYTCLIDSTGQVSNHHLAGKVFIDANNNCDYDGGEAGINLWLLTLQQGNTKWYANTNSDGFFDFPVDTGEYTLQLVLNNQYWTTCANGQQLTITPAIDTLQLLLPVQSQISCPLLEIDISTPLLRRCFPNRYTVSYCNQGTTEAVGAYIDLNFDPYLIIDSASVPFTDQLNNQIHVPVGDIAAGECGSFDVYATVDCESTILGQTHCVTAHAYPDTICSPAPGWSGANIEVAGSCEADSVTFRIRNTGTGDMQGPLNYIIIEDLVVLFTEPFQLNQQDSLIVKVPANGSTWRLETPQEPGNPDDSQPSVTIEGCGLNSDQVFSLGYVTQFAENDGDPFIAADCRENVASFDPNEKSVAPRGYGEENFIENDQRLYYHIDFQNTGTDTAFVIVIRDTLSEFLDPATIMPGATSYPARFEVYGEGIIKWTLEDIRLPDSLVNEPASHGFVNFSITQKPGNQTRALILNQAAIWFDYNAPILTNTTHQVVMDEFYIVGTKNNELDAFQMLVYPNPVRSQLVFDLGDISKDDISLTVVDIYGRVIFKKLISGSNYHLDVNNWKSGVYFYIIKNESGQAATGKIIKH